MTVDVLGKMNRSVVGHNGRRYVEEDHLYRPLQVHLLRPARIHGRKNPIAIPLLLTFERPLGEGDRILNADTAVAKIPS